MGVMDPLELAQQIAKHLPRGWSAELRFDHRLPFLVRPDGAHIVMHLGGYQRTGRVEFIGCWPMYRDGRGYSGGKRLAITCADSRPPDVMARELVRRLLPEYDAAFAAADAWVKNHEADEDEAKDVAKRIADSVDASVGQGRWNRGDGVPVLANLECVNKVTVRPAYRWGSGKLDPVSVDMNLSSVSPEVAAEILHLLREAEADKPVLARVAPADVAQEALDDLPDLHVARRSMG